MVFQKLEIEREQWGERKGQITGAARFSSEHADITIQIPEKFASKITEMFAETLIDAAGEMACVVKGDIIEGLTLEKATENVSGRKSVYKPRDDFDE